MHRIVCNQNLVEIERLEVMNADEYYSTLNTFIRVAKEMKDQAEK